MNRGGKIANGTYILFAHADCRFNEDGIKINNQVYNNNNYNLTDFLNLNEIKISVGKKRFGILKILV